MNPIVDTEEGETKCETYSYSFDCPNCFHEETHSIPRGVTVSRFKEGTNCERCGCVLKENTNDLSKYHVGAPNNDPRTCVGPPCPPDVS